jgi:enoyl-CoA hydratase/carnithine racemase
MVIRFFSLADGQQMTWHVQKRGTVAVVVFDRPPDNLMSYVLLDALDGLLAEIAADDDVTVVLLTGGVPGYFVGHADLDDVQQLVDGRPGPGDPDAWGRALGRLALMPQPVIAAVNGQAWGGGCELALACLMRIASTSAHFRFVEVGAGAIPGAGGTQRLPRLVGASRAAYMILSGCVVTAADALEIGLVDAVRPDDSFLEEALAWVAPMAAQPRHTVIAAKRAMLDGLAMALGDGLENEQRIFRSVLTSPESRRMFGPARPAEPGV